MNVFPIDFRNNLTGFGGDATKNRAQHRSAMNKTPVILVHGNGGHSVHPQWGMQTMANFLRAMGYQDCELWAMDYLGENNNATYLQNPHTRHIDAFRMFVDTVRNYLGVDKLDFIAHSLGSGMVNGYLRGLQSDGQWNHEDHRFNVAGTFVSLAGATYGLGRSVSEFTTGSSFEIHSHEFHGVIDDTPFGSNKLSEQITPVEEWKETTSLDNAEVRYVAFTAVGDVTDHQHQDTGRREGADVNKRFNLGPFMMGHEKIIKDQAVFDDFKEYLDHTAPQPLTETGIDEDSSNDDLVSVIESGTFESKLPYEAKVTGTLTEHSIGGRLTVAQYIELGLVLGFTAVVTLYLMNGKWVHEPEMALV